MTSCDGAAGTTKNEPGNFSALQELKVEWRRQDNIARLQKGTALCHGGVQGAAGPQRRETTPRYRERLLEESIFEMVLFSFYFFEMVLEAQFQREEMGSSKVKAECFRSGYRK